MALQTVCRALLVLLLFSQLDGTSAGKVKKAIFGDLFGSEKHAHVDQALADAEQAELVAFLKKHGFEKYASDEFIEILDEELAYDSIEDMTHLVADEDYNEVDMPLEDAEKIQAAARREMMRRFLASVPLPITSEDSSEVYVKHLDPLIAAGFDEPDNVAELQEDEAVKMGIAKESVKILTTYAEEYETRLLLHVVLTTHLDASGHKPYSSEAAWRPFVDALVKAGVRSLSDLAQLTSADVPSIATKDLVALQNDPRVLQHTAKQEL